MSAGASGAPLEPFFLAAARGERFCIFHPAAAAARGAIVYLHPFAEEMNKSRRMAALQSRLFSAGGFAVLQIDLFGCGDSSGDFGEARWDIWMQDVELAVNWIRRRAPGPLYLWGLRLGALLAVDYAAHAAQSFAGLVLWQPIVNGQQFLTQFLRLRVANEMIADGLAKTSTQDLRDTLGAGTALEIAGYDLAPELAHAIDRLKLAEIARGDVPAHWFEVGPEADRPLSPASRRAADAWIARDVDVRVHTVAGEPFWNTVEIAECPELLARTTRTVAEAAT